MQKHLKPRFYRVLCLLAVLTGVLCSTGPAKAHPHVWIDAVSEVLLNESGQVTGVRVYWAFDEFYTTFSLEGADTNKNGTYEQDEIAPMVWTMIKNLGDFRYFLDVQGPLDRQIEYGEVTEAGGRWVNGRLAIFFVVPFKTPVDPVETPLTFAMYDPSFYISIELAEGDSVRFSGAENACTYALRKPDSVPETASLSESFFQGSDANEGLGAAFATWVDLQCG